MGKLMMLKLLKASVTFACILAVLSGGIAAQNPTTGISILGTPVAGNCVSWNTATTLKDAGSPCGSATFPSTTNLIAGNGSGGGANSQIPSVLGPSLSTSSGTVLASTGGANFAYGYTAYGDSITAGVGATYGYVSLISQDLATGATTNNGTAGDAAGDMVYRALANSNPNDYQDPVITTMIGTNDVTNYGTTSTNKAVFQQFVAGANAWLAMSSTNKFLPANALITQGGTWTSDTTFADATGATATANGATLTMSSAYVEQCGCFYVMQYLYGSSTGTFTVSVDGVNQTDTFTGLNTFSAQYQGNAPKNIGTTPAGLLRFTGISRGSHTIVITVSSSSGTVGIVGLMFPPTNRYRAATGPNVFMAGVPPEQNNSNSTATQTYNGWVNSVALNLASDGLPITFVDVNANLDYYVDYNAYMGCVASTNPGLHPNFCGHRHLAQAFEDAMKTTDSIQVNGMKNGGRIGNFFDFMPDGSFATQGFNLMCAASTSGCEGWTFVSGQPLAPAVTGSYYGVHYSNYPFANCYTPSNIRTVTTFTYASSGVVCTAFYNASGTGDTIFGPNLAGTSSYNYGSQPVAFRSSVYNGTATTIEDYDIITQVSSGGSTANLWMKFYNVNSVLTGQKGYEFFNHSGYGPQIRVDNATVISTFDYSLPSAARTFKVPDVTGTLSTSTFPINLTAQSAALSGQSLGTPGTTGFFKVEFTAKVTQAATSSSILGGTTGFSLSYTDGNDSTTQTPKCGAFDQTGSAITISSGNTANSTSAMYSGSCVIYASSSAAITYSFGYSSTGATSMQYALNVRVVAE
jgi:lysophospholipase L1-like esterase